MANLSLSRALRRLSHPSTLVALGVLLLNDHLLRTYWPSWVTGKLGDIAWLFIAPLALAALIALVLPRRWQASHRLTGGVAFGFVGVLFVLAKTAPPVHASVVAIAETLLGVAVGLRLDPSDLIALPALAGSAVLWAKNSPAVPQPATDPRKFRRGWAALAAVALLTVANAPAPDPGIFCVAARDGAIYAFAAYGAFESSDGGLTWSSSTAPQVDCGSPWEGSPTPQVLKLPGDDRAYRFTAGQAIEMSQDGGQTWQQGFSQPALSEAQEALVQRSRLNVTLRAIPMDGLVDPSTGNAIFAMGQNGALVATPAGEWRTVAVGAYRAPEPLSAGDVVGLLVGEVLLALGLALLSFATLITAADRGRRVWHIFLLAISWLVWLGIVFVLGPARLYGYGAGIGAVALLALGVLVLVALIVAIVRGISGLRPVMLPALSAGLIGAILFLVPYVLWGMDVISDYLLAAGLAVLLGLATLVVAARAITRMSRAIP